jgi:cell division protein FtsI/penicillin-binding protein 2
MIAKTGTAQILYKQTVDAASAPLMHNHVWFGGVSFDKDATQRDKEPELAVIVYLKHAEKGGREAAPLGVEIIKKWREISAQHASEKKLSTP